MGCASSQEKSSKPRKVEETKCKPSVLNSAHWVRKMKTIFLTLDTDHDGFITLEDNQASPIRMVRAFGLSKEKADAVLEYTRRVGWVEYVNAGVEQPDGHRVSEQTFIKNMARAVDSQKDVGKDLAECHLILFDLEEPGFLSREEYLKVFGTQQVDEAVSVRRFEMLDSDQDGRIKVDDYIDDIRFFFTDVGPKDDQENTDLKLKESKRVVVDGSGDDEHDGPGDDQDDGSGDDERNHPHRNNIFGELVTG